MLTGLKTLLFNALVIAAVAVLNYFIEFNWAGHFPSLAPWAPAIVAAANLALRFVTTTPVLKKY